MRNPFTPTFGASPPLLVGRAALLDQFSEGLDAGVGDPARATLYVGNRGSGKTVLLNAVEDAAKDQGWVVISETATPGLIDRIVNERLPIALSQVKTGGKRTHRRSTGVTAPAGLGGASWEAVEDYPVRQGLRVQVEEITDHLATNDTGILFTVDEIHHALMPEIAQLSAVIQHSFRENRDVALAGACLQSGLDSLLTEPSTTFLRRAERHRLGPVPLEDVTTALTQPVHDNGRRITEEAALLAARATGGYPFLIQLIGYHMWRINPKLANITIQDVEAAIPAARRRLGTLVFEPSIHDLSDVDKTFLAAMSVDEGASRIADVAKRMDVDGNYANVYRRRLIDEELIADAGHGKIAFATPGLRDYLREHVVIDGLNDA